MNNYWTSIKHKGCPGVHWCLRSFLYLCSCYQCCQHFPLLVVHTVLWSIVIQQLLFLFIIWLWWSPAGTLIDRAETDLLQQDVHFLITSSRASRHMQPSLGIFFFLPEQPTGRRLVYVVADKFWRWEKAMKVKFCFDFSLKELFFSCRFRSFCRQRHSLQCVFFYRVFCHRISPVCYKFL